LLPGLIGFLMRLSSDVFDLGENRIHIFAEKLLSDVLLPFPQTKFSMVSRQKRRSLDRELLGVTASSRCVILSAKSEMKSAFDRPTVNPFEGDIADCWAGKRLHKTSCRCWSDTSAKHCGLHLTDRVRCTGQPREKCLTGSKPAEGTMDKGPDSVLRVPGSPPSGFQTTDVRNSPSQRNFRFPWFSHSYCTQATSRVPLNGHRVSLPLGLSSP
jgi:hypothetical protein